MGYPFTPPAHAQMARTLAFSADSSLLITGSDDKTINVFDVRASSSSQSVYIYAPALSGTEKTPRLTKPSFFLPL
jgi:WD40 repeat protein